MCYLPLLTESLNWRHELIYESRPDEGKGKSPDPVAHHPDFLAGSSDLHDKEPEPMQLGYTRLTS